MQSLLSATKSQHNFLLIFKCNTRFIGQTCTSLSLSDVNKVQICIKYTKLDIAIQKTRDGKSQLFDALSHKSHQNLANCIIVHGSSEMEGRGRIPSEAMNVTSAPLEKSL